MFQSYAIVSVLESVADSRLFNVEYPIGDHGLARLVCLGRAIVAQLVCRACHRAGMGASVVAAYNNTREQMQTLISDNANWGLLWLIANG